MPHGLLVWLAAITLGMDEAPPPPAPPAAADGGAAEAPAPPSFKGLLGDATKRAVSGAIHIVGKEVFDRLRDEIPKIQKAMQDRAISQRAKGREKVNWLLLLLPAPALILVPLWLWRRGTFKRAREKGIKTWRVIATTGVASLSVAALLFVFVQIFVLLEIAKTRLSVAAPSQLLAIKALEHSIEAGKGIIDTVQVGGGTQPSAAPAGVRPAIQAIAPAVAAVLAGTEAPETFLQSVVRNASEIWKSGALQSGYQVFQYARPILDYMWSVLIALALVLFFRYAKPAIEEIADHVSADQKHGRTLIGTVFRNMLRESIVIGIFLVPYAIITTIITFATYWVTDFGAEGIVESVFAAIDRLIAEDLPTPLIVTFFIGIAAFMIELVVLLVAVSAVLLGGWMHFLHDRVHGGVRRFPGFLMRFLFMTVRLVPTLVAIAAILYIGLGFLTDSRDTIGSTVEMLVPLFMLVALNLGLWAARFFKGLRHGLSLDAWHPPGTKAPGTTPLQPELP